jgi:hypothetical protein
MIRMTTSASNLLRRKLCPGSANAERDIPEQPESEDATEGTLLHAMMADPSMKAPLRAEA